MDEKKRKEIYQKMVQRVFEHFDQYMILRWGNVSKIEEITEETREKAYHNFYRKIKWKDVANRQTIQRWFGLNGRTLPTREHVMKIAFALEFSVEEWNAYLKDSLLMSGIQVNDYEEFIAVYCLQNRISYSRYMQLVSFFEEHCDFTIIPKQTSKTKELREYLEQIKGLSEEEFLAWMYEHREMFKGYSLTTYRYYQSLIEEVFELFRKDVRDLLRQSLYQTDYFEWAREQLVPAEKIFEVEEIRRYIKNDLRKKEPQLDKERASEIRYFLRMLGADKKHMSDFLEEIYGEICIENEYLSKSETEELQKQLGNVSAKYVSELIHIAELKEELMQLRMELSRTRKSGENNDNVKKAYQNVKQRVRFVSRADLLVLAQYISYKKYDGEEARQQFVTLANTILETCDMTPLDEKYCLDYMLLGCFQEEENFTLAEMLE